MAVLVSYVDAASGEVFFGQQRNSLQYRGDLAEENGQSCTFLFLAPLNMSYSGHAHACSKLYNLSEEAISTDKSCGPKPDLTAAMHLTRTFIAAALLLTTCSAYDAEVDNAARAFKPRRKKSKSQKTLDAGCASVTSLFTALDTFPTPTGSIDVFLATAIPTSADLDDLCSVATAVPPTLSSAYANYTSALGSWYTSVVQDVVSLMNLYLMSRGRLRGHCDYRMTDDVMTESEGNSLPSDRAGDSGSGSEATMHGRPSSLCCFNQSRRRELHGLHVLFSYIIWGIRCTSVILASNSSGFMDALSHLVGGSIDSRACHDLDTQG